MNRLPIIGFEGLDGVGKTTAARNIAKHFDGKIATQLDLMPVWSTHRKEVNAGDDIEARFNYFHALNRRQLQLARAIQRSGRMAVLESTAYRTYATHRVLGSTGACEPIDPTDLPDLTIRLYVPETEREQHLRSRDGGLIYSSHWDTQLHERADELHTAYESFGLPLVGTHLTKTEVTAMILQIIRFDTDTV